MITWDVLLCARGGVGGANEWPRREVYVCFELNSTLAVYQHISNRRASGRCEGGGSGYYPDYSCPDGLELEQVDLPHSTAGLLA